jgi:hypothetical protein
MFQKCVLPPSSERPLSQKAVTFTLKMGFASTDKATSRNKFYKFINSMEQSPSTEADISSASQEILTFYINQMVVTVLK